MAGKQAGSDRSPPGLTKRGEQHPAPRQLPLPMLDLSFLQLYSHQIREEGLAAKLGPSAFTLFVVMRSFCIVGGKDDGVCRLSLSAMERSTGMSRSTVAKCLKILEKEKLVTVIKQDERGTKRYYLLDTFTDAASKKPVATVVYQPTQQAKVRAELEAWTAGRVVQPSHPAVTLIQVNQVTNNTTINVNVTLDPSRVESPSELLPWIEEVVKRVSRNPSKG